MRLRIIAEEGMSGSQNVVRDAADALGSLIQYVYTLDDQGAERLTLDAFLSKPTPENWKRSRWLLDSAIEKSGAPEDSLRGWAGLKTLTSPVITSSLYDVNSKFTRGTPLQNVSLTSKKQDDLKSAVGPQGYVSAFSELGDMPEQETGDLLKRTADEADDIDTAVERDLPTNVQRIEKF